MISADVGPVRAESRLERADLRLDRADLRSGRSDLGSGRADFRPGKVDLKLEGSFQALTVRPRAICGQRYPLPCFA